MCISHFESNCIFSVSPLWQYANALPLIPALFFYFITTMLQFVGWFVCLFVFLIKLEEHSVHTCFNTGATLALS